MTENHKHSEKTDTKIVEERQLHKLYAVKKIKINKEAKSDWAKLKEKREKIMHKT